MDVTDLHSITQVSVTGAPKSTINWIDGAFTGVDRGELFKDGMAKGRADLTHMQKDGACESDPEIGA